MRVSLLRADARALPLRDGCVQCCVTSPPYFGLRNYNVDGQIGLEPTPDAYVAQLVAVFREVWRVLRDDGVLFLNLGDSYGRGERVKWVGDATRDAHGFQAHITQSGNYAQGAVQPNKQLLGIPWRAAFALQADGWYLRSDIIWAKPNPMPESVTDRPTKAHEYVFLLSKSPAYYYDKDALCEPYQDATLRRGRSIRQVAADGTKTYRFNGEPLDSASIERGRNARSVWTLPTQPFRGAHFAVMPEALAERCIKAGSRPSDLVLDPFGGSGTVVKVARALNRRGVCTELNPAYLALADRRISGVQVSLLEATA